MLTIREKRLAEWAGTGTDKPPKPTTVRGLGRLQHYDYRVNPGTPERDGPRTTRYDPWERTHAHGRPHKKGANCNRNKRNSAEKGRVRRKRKAIAAMTRHRAELIERGQA